SETDPHCPACLQAHGTLVAVSGPHDRKPYWRCTATPEDCGGRREYQDKTYSWSGWRTDFANSVADWKGDTIVDDPQTLTIDPSERTKRWGYITHETEALSGVV